MAVSNVAPPHISRLKSPGVRQATADATASMSKDRTRVASSDWCASRNVVSVTSNFFCLTVHWANFRAPISKSNWRVPGGGAPLPPGKAGLVVATIRVDGAIRSPNGMFAVVTNPDSRVYFLREGDQLYDGDVEKIGLDGVTFKEVSKDAFGKSVEKIVTKRIYPSAGEQQ